MIPEGWVIKKWGEIVTLEYGKSLNNYQVKKGKIPVYGTNGQIGFTDKPICTFPSVIVGRKGAYRGVHYSKTPFFVIDTAFYLNPIIEDLDLKFAYYQLLTQNINEMDSGSAIPSTSRGDFYNLDLLLPDIKSQRRIASILSSLDDKIELNLQMNKTLESIAQAIFKEWFVDFRFPGYDGELTDGMPYGWSIESFFKTINIVYGKNLPTTSLKEKGYPVFGGNGIIGYYDNFLYEKPQIIIACRGAASGKINQTLPNSFVTNNSLVFEIKEDSLISFCFLKYFCLNIDFSRYVTGSAQPQITIENLRTLEFLVPAYEVIKLFESLIQPIEERLLNNYVENQTLTQIRDSLLPKLMTGKIRVA